MHKNTPQHRMGAVQKRIEGIVLPQHDALDALLHGPHPIPRLRGILMYKADSFPIVHKQPIIPPASIMASPLGQAYRTGAASCSAKFAQKVLNLVHLSDAPTPIEEYAATVA